MKHLRLIWALFLMLYTICVAATNDSILTADQKRLELIDASLNANVSPCEDFTNYSCGGVDQYGHKTLLVNLDFLDGRVGDEIATAVRQFRPTSDYKFLQDIHHYYRSCDDQKDKTDTLRYLRWMASEADVKWSLVEGSDTALPDLYWVKLLAMTRTYGFNDIFLNEDVMPLKEDASKLTIEFKTPSLVPLTIFDAYTYELEYLLKADEIANLDKFQKKLYELTKNGTSSHDMNESSPVSLEDLGMPWINKYIQILLEQSAIDTNMIVYVQDKQYLKTLYEFLSQYDNRFLCDYIQIKFLWFLKTHETHSTSKNCITSIRNLFALPVQWIYKRRHHELQKELPHIQKIFDNLKAIFRKTLTHNFYEFQIDIVEYFQTKLDSIELNIDAVTGEDLDEFYKNLHLNSTDYFGNRLKLFKLNFKNTHDIISKRLIKNSIAMLSLRPQHNDRSADHQAGLYHLPYLFARHNVIFLPLTLLQYPFYESGLSDVFSYSTIGFLLAREITKAFDPHYLPVDANGRYNPVIEAAIHSNAKFQHAAKTLQDSLITYQDMQHEAFGDISGLKLAYDTVLELHPDPWSIKVTLQDKKVKMDKVFFLSFAHNYCSSGCSLEILQNWYYDSCKRVEAATGHFDKFGQAFECGNSTSNQLWH